MGNAEIIESVEVFVSICKRDFRKARYGEWIFRGHSKEEFELLPSVARIEHKSNTFEKFERSIFDIFKRDSAALAPSYLRNEFDWLVFARHHGLPTRLLDWTTNPLAALYFCVKSAKNSDGAFIALHAPKRMPDDVYRSQCPLEVDSTYKFLPAVTNSRMAAQMGLFTIQGKPKTKLDDQLKKSWRLIKYKISSKNKGRILYDLFRLGVHEGTLFPDVDGIARHLTWRHTVDANMD